MKKNQDKQQEVKTEKTQCEDVNECEETCKEDQEPEQVSDEITQIIEKITAEKESLVDMLKRERADFENYKKRNAMLSSQAHFNGCFDAVEKVLPVMDNFERAMVNADESDPFVQGMAMIQRQLGDVLSSLDVKEIEALGKPFDPELMNAVMQVERGEDQEANTVAEVLQKGYMIKDKVLRHAMVKVTN